MAQSSFGAPNWNKQREPFKAGDHKTNMSPYSKPVGYIPPPHSTAVNNISYAAKWGTAQQRANPTSYLVGAFPPNHMEMSKPPTARNGTFHNKHKYGPV